MYHSVSFGDKNTWTDWRLIPRSLPLFNPPAVETSYIPVPGGPPLDLSEALTGRPVYTNRTGSLDFITSVDFLPVQILYSDIMGHLHGKYLRAALEDDPGYYYQGRFTVNSFKVEAWYSVVTIDYNLEPYKLDVFGSTGNWLWNPFNFETGVIREYNNLTVSGSKTVNVIGDEMPTTVTITTSAAMSVTFGGVVYPLPKGSTIVPSIIIREGNNQLVFTGNGVVTIDYRGGRL